MKIVAYLLLTSMVFFACKKEGCTDLEATNTTEGAKKDDGSCVYESSVVFWHTAATRSVMSTNGISSLNYYLDGTLLGTTGITTVYPTAPDCNESTAFVRSIAYDESSTKQLNYQVTNQSGALIFSGIIVFVNGACIAEELSY